jgi:peptide/nickel transport system substrate-binding protein
MNRRDQSIVAGLLLLLVVLGGVLALPRQAPEAADEPTPDVSMPPTVTYREGVVGVPDSITPVTARTRSERTLVGLIFSGLVRLGPGTTYQPDLASSWTTDAAGTTWTFTIRADAEWQDGQPVTSDDVLYTVGALKSPDVSGAGVGAWAEVTVDAVDAKTVRFRLGSPIAGFLAAATQPLLPAHLLANVPYADLATSDYAHLPVGSGPYALTDIDGSRAVLVPASGVLSPASPPASQSAGPSGGPSGGPSASPTAASSSSSSRPSGDSLATSLPRLGGTTPSPYIDEIDVRFFADEQALADAFRAGSLDATSGLSTAVTNELSGVAGVKRLVYPTTTVSTVLLNLKPSHPELRDPAVRTALLGAIDRDKLVSDVLGGNGERADGLVPPASAAYDSTSASPVPFDPVASAKAMTAAGWSKKNGSWFAPHAKAPYHLELLSVTSAANQRLAATATFVADAWRAFGLTVDLVQLPATEMASRMRAGTYTAGAVDIAEGLEPDLYSLLASSQVRTSGTNLGGYQDTTLDPLLEAARKPGTPDERAAAWKALEIALAARMPVLPLAWNHEVMLARGLAGVSPRLIVDPGDRYWDVLAWRLAATR